MLYMFIFGKASKEFRDRWSRIVVPNEGNMQIPGDVRSINLNDKKLIHLLLSYILLTTGNWYVHYLLAENVGKAEFLDVNYFITTEHDFGFVTEKLVWPIAEGRQFINRKSHRLKMTLSQSYLEKQWD